MPVLGLEREDVGGFALTRRMWWTLREVERRVGVDLLLAQGSWHDGPLSGDTHSSSGAVDLRVGNLTTSERAAVVLELRRLGVCAWLRDEAHGGFAPHIHGVDRFDPRLSSGARWQVAQYDRGRNGLSSGGADYHPRPEQRDGFTEEDDMPTAEEIAEAVWTHTRPTYPDRHVYGLLVDVKRTTEATRSVQAAQVAADDAAPAGVDLDALADAVAARVSTTVVALVLDGLAKRLQS